jgi:hypothetical protein
MKKTWNQEPAIVRLNGIFWDLKLLLVGDQPENSNSITAYANFS